MSEFTIFGGNNTNNDLIKGCALSDVENARLVAAKIIAELADNFNALIVANLGRIVQPLENKDVFKVDFVIADAKITITPSFTDNQTAEFAQFHEIDPFGNFFLRLRKKTDNLTFLDKLSGSKSTGDKTGTFYTNPGWSGYDFCTASTWQDMINGINRGLSETNKIAQPAQLARVA